MINNIIRLNCHNYNYRLNFCDYKISIPPKITSTHNTPPFFRGNGIKLPNLLYTMRFIIFTFLFVFYIPFLFVTKTCRDKDLTDMNQSAVKSRIEFHGTCMEHIYVVLLKIYNEFFKTNGG